MLEAFQATVYAGFSTRQDGNLALHVDDIPAVVLKNRQRLSEKLGVPFSTWTCADQVHGNRVAVVDQSKIGAGRERLHDVLDGYDALITNVPGILLTSFYADCVPLYFYDPVQRVVGLAHAGWKGTVANIVAETLTQMHQAYGTKVKDVHAAIGPSIGECCYEVDERVLTAVNDVLGYARFGAGKAMLDLKEINRQIMIKTGILQNHIEISEACTSCRTDLYFSHRAEHGKTGRMASWIGLMAKE